MRFKDYIVDKAIKAGYNNVFAKEPDNGKIDNAILKVAKKLGYKIFDEITTIKKYPCENKDWKKILDRYSYKTGIRFLEWDNDTRSSIYFDENGQLFFGIGGVKFNPVSLIEHHKLYAKHKDFLNFAREYYKNIIDEKRQYLMIGIEGNNRYYICSNGKCYKKIGESNEYLDLDDYEQKIASKYLVDLG